MSWLKLKGFERLQSRRRIWGVEVDLIAYHPRAKRWWFVEVKSVQGLDWLEGRWSHRQRHRLERVAQAWAEDHSSPTQVILALVIGPELQVKILAMEDVVESTANS